MQLILNLYKLVDIGRQLVMKSAKCIRNIISKIVSITILNFMFTDHAHDIQVQFLPSQP